MENCKDIKDILSFIVTLQKNTCFNNECEGCTRPFLGPNELITFNTRPVQFQCCQSDTLWTMPYILNGETGTSNVFKVENVDCNCATFRILAPNEGTFPYSSTNSFFTIDIDCILALQCLPDTYTI